ncbi:MAG TPA: YihY/virulence factor BrkB family protein [Polyangiaceae bacterium]|jgi:membrane protein|nr:YihY/virulence factor BrkB family protein [Polyangiaceae bacterium]
MILPGRDVPFREFARQLWRRSDDDNLIDYAGSIAFSLVLAVFPFLLFAVSVAGLVIDPHLLDSLLEPVRRVLLPEAADVVIKHLHELTARSRMGLLTFSAVGAVWVASGAITALATAFNAAYEVTERRPYWKTRGLAVLLTLLAVVLFILASVIAFAAPSLLGHLGGPLGAVLLWLRWPTTILIMMVTVAGLYYILPDVEQRFGLITPGSVVAVVLWLLGSLGFSYYVTHFGAYQVVYGALGSVVVLLLWMWISALAVLLGAEINAVLEHLSSEGKRRGGRSTEPSRDQASVRSKGAPASAAPAALADPEVN